MADPVAHVDIDDETRRLIEAAAAVAAPIFQLTRWQWTHGVPDQAQIERALAELIRHQATDPLISSGRLMVFRQDDRRRVYIEIADSARAHDAAVLAIADADTATLVDLLSRILGAADAELHEWKGADGSTGRHLEWSARGIDIDTDDAAILRALLPEG